MITPEMSIAEVMRMDPEVAPVFMSYGMHCLYCPHASAESIAEASLVRSRHRRERACRLAQRVFRKRREASNFSKAKITHPPRLIARRVLFTRSCP